MAHLEPDESVLLFSAGFVLCAVAAVALFIGAVIGNIETCREFTRAGVDVRVIESVCR